MYTNSNKYTNKYRPTITSLVLDVFQVGTTFDSALEPGLLGGDVDGVGEVHEGLGAAVVECLVPEQMFLLNIFVQKLQEPLC